MNVRVSTAIAIAIAVKKQHNTTQHSGNGSGNQLNSAESTIRRKYVQLFCLRIYAFDSLMEYCNGRDVRVCVQLTIQRILFCCCCCAAFMCAVRTLDFFSVIRQFYLILFTLGQLCGWPRGSFHGLCRASELHMYSSVLRVYCYYHPAMLLPSSL